MLNDQNWIIKSIYIKFIINHITNKIVIKKPISKLLIITPSSRRHRIVKIRSRLKKGKSYLGIKYLTARILSSRFIS